MHNTSRQVQQHQENYGDVNSWSDEYTWRHVDTSTFRPIGGELAMISRMQEVRPEEVATVTRVEQGMGQFNKHQVRWCITNTITDGSRLIRRNKTVQKIRTNRISIRIKYAV